MLVNYLFSTLVIYRNKIFYPIICLCELNRIFRIREYGFEIEYYRLLAYKIMKVELKVYKTVLTLKYAITLSLKSEAVDFNKYKLCSYF